MSADLMIICKEDDSGFEGHSCEAALRFGETSMGEPHDTFSRWVAERFDGSPCILEQMAGITDHRFTVLAQADADAVLSHFDTLEHKDYLNRDCLATWLQEHVGKQISCERW